MGILQRLNPQAQHFASAKAQVRDAVGRVLEVGDEVLVLTPKTLLRVAEIKPILDPGAPPNAMLVTLVTRMAIACPRDQGIEDLYFLRHQAEIGDGAIQGGGTQADDVDPPPAGDETGPAEKATLVTLE
jgi:hypothetical protein